ncbi:MAG: phosphoglucomutase/phosphomannomutase family protein [Chloroflexi bacterium]|nr:phosphoglucomutase/phosphomannomutase family protein [Chloroflexota bacterium]
MAATIKFGTDGWRAIIAEDFTFDNVRLCAQAVANYLRDSGAAKNGLVVAYDTRFASEDFGAAVAEVAAGNGIKAYLCDKAAPTPVGSYAILEKKAAGAVVITASHNPARWNGFKYKPEYAGSASPEVIAELEKRIVEIQAKGGVRTMPQEEGLKKGLIERFDPRAPYLQHISELVDFEKLRRAGLKVAADSMFGAGAGYFKSILSGDKTKVTEINGERNPTFPGIQPEPITRNLSRLSTLIRRTKADVGLATDGDADRIGAMDEKGNFITQLQVYALLALYLLEVRGERGPIIKTVTTTSMIYKLGELYKVPVHETAVGFKYVGPVMIANNALLGGEESGGFGFRGHIPERDGILAGLYILDLVTSMKKTPSQLIEYLYSKVGPHYYDRIDLDFEASKREEIIKRVSTTSPSQIDGVSVASMDTKDGFRFFLTDGSWLLIRFSGTEPIIRVYCETDSPGRVKRILAAGERMVGV